MIERQRERESDVEEEECRATLSLCHLSVPPPLSVFVSALRCRRYGVAKEGDGHRCHGRTSVFSSKAYSLSELKDSYRRGYVTSPPPLPQEPLSQREHVCVCVCECVWAFQCGSVRCVLWSETAFGIQP